ncbi:MAG: alpha/beta fold hydrolase [Acidobacteria bacterium]|jgi:predicted alpha/beta-fold hydrolase|nr:alpha/beta fold hydrolase [Acidobacteriota bacterium]
MTIYAWARRRRFPLLPAPRPRYFDVAPDARVLAHCYWQPHPAEAVTVLALHGLEGSSSAHYMQGIADKAWARGMNVVLLNQRNCGDTERLSAGLYHSGLTDDPAFVLRELLDADRLPAIGVIGYSLGGNLTLKLTGEFGREAPAQFVGACAVSPTLDLPTCIDALERPSNVLYQWNFVRNLKARMRRKDQYWPGKFDLSKLRQIRTVREFDDAYTAPSHGFRDAADYYYRASSRRVATRIARPTLIVAAHDDPFIPSAQFDCVEVRSNPHVTIAITAHGGHCAYVAAPTADSDGYWAETTAVDWIARQAAASR